MLNNNINNANYSPSFQAALRITVPVKEELSGRVRNIQKAFAAETKHQGGNLSITKISEVGESDLYHLGCDPESATVFAIKTQFDEMLEKLSDNEIVSKMIKIFQSLKALNKRDAVVSKLESEIFRLSRKKETFLSFAKDSKEKGDKKMAETFKYSAKRFGMRIDTLKNEKDDCNKTFIHETKKITNGDKEILNGIIDVIK